MVSTNATKEEFDHIEFHLIAVIRDNAGRDLDIDNRSDLISTLVRNASPALKSWQDVLVTKLEDTVLGDPSKRADVDYLKTGISFLNANPTGSDIIALMEYIETGVLHG